MTSTPILPVTYLPGSYLPRELVAGSTTIVILYESPAPTGWQSTAVRVGPDPRFATILRRSGQA